MLDFAAVSQAFLERKLGRIIHFWDPVMTCFAAIGTQGGGWNAEFGSLAQRYPALTALFTLLDEALCVCVGGEGGAGSLWAGGESDKSNAQLIAKRKEVAVVELWHP